MSEGKGLGPSLATKIKNFSEQIDSM